ncbi:aminotransferase class I/II-fold pyridoxal phosphate-dependent enzyme [Peptoniphilus stercorisuis]|uniref:Cystathionine beta-lyase family protein involved in aluminum resistance n=1 Tax=Peptoniphilus stercorisuis TaxID=1436965 RepID=A0ABS4KCK6_9FIRM|nr:methionine gamma-lyase family protein [Peptoniphilus stercorisuis]MBP2025524.1 cystathionine beta-lyase family protein involved in aluminum resistance [Peptoniphilus stercorisuis]
MKEYKDLLFNSYNIDEKVVDYVNNLESELHEKFDALSLISEYNQVKILKAMQDNRLAATDFNWTTGYGYGDIGREKVESIFSNIFNTEDALVRPNIVSGTHAISLALLSVLQHGDHVLSGSGTPYDTLLKVIGITGNEPGNMLEQGIEYSEAELIDNKISIENIKEKLQKNTKVIMLQRSTGYSDRRAITADEFKEAIAGIKKIAPDVIIFVDNCYGEFTDLYEPSDFGADIMAGSLIKNPGGGLAFSGGYVVGKEIYINRIANRLTAPGIGKECGLSFGMTRQILQGLFISPKVVEDAIKGALLFTKIFTNLGYDCTPSLEDKRSDIILAIKFKDPEKVKAFCQSIQEASPVDAHFLPEPWDMPGYDDPVIMAAGAFIEGSSIELSADGPMREPYYAYYQGGLTYYHAKFALIKVLQSFLDKNLINIDELI